MADSRKYIDEDRISLKELLERLLYFYKYCIQNFRYIIIAVIVGGILGYVYTFKRPTYYAETTFALEESGGLGGLGQAAGLASAVGVNLGPLAGGESGIFEGENIMQLYTSQKMLEATLLTDIEIDGQKEKLIYKYARERKLDKKWKKKSYLKDITFDLPRDLYNHHHDSILFEVAEEIRKSFISVSKPVRRLNIISVKVEFKDPEFARHFNIELVKNVNEFYFETKTKKTSIQVATFQAQADSIKNVIDQYVTDMAIALESTPNPNLLNRSVRVPAQQKQIDLQSSLVAYSEIVKSLELSKLNHLNKTPLLQIVDSPTKYLDNNKWKWYKGIVIGMFLAGLLIVVFFAFRLILKSVLSEDTVVDSING